MRRRLRAFALIFSLTVPSAGIVEHACAQGAARSLDLDPSARASGMGAASSAVFWGDDTNQWGNPALLGYHRGVRYERGRIRLVPGLAEDVFFESDVLKLGGGGIAIWSAGRPYEQIGGSMLDYGQIELTSPGGTPVGSYAPHEKIAAWGWAISVGQLTANVARLAGRSVPDLSRYADVSFGMSFKQVRIDLAPPEFQGSAAAAAGDLGLLLRLTPIRSTLAPQDIGLPIRADASYGWSVLSYDDAAIAFIDEDRAYPVSRHRRHGVASRVSLGLPAAIRQGMDRRGIGWLASGLDPFASLGLAYDRARVSAGDLGSSSYRTSGLGLELTLMNLVAIRRGWFKDITGQVDGSTSGWSVGFHLGEFGGLRYDWASFPQARTLPKREPKALSLFVDPVEIWSALQPDR